MVSNILMLLALSALPQFTIVYFVLWVQHQVSNLGLSRLPLSFSRLGEITTKESELTNFSSRARLPAGDSLAPHIGATVARLVSCIFKSCSVYLGPVVI